MAAEPEKLCTQSLRQAQDPSRRGLKRGVVKKRNMWQRANVSAGGVHLKRYAGLGQAPAGTRSSLMLSCHFRRRAGLVRVCDKFSVGVAGPREFAAGALGEGSSGALWRPLLRRGGQIACVYRHLRDQSQRAGGA